MKYFEHITEKASIKALKNCDLTVLDSETANPKIKQLVDDLLKQQTESAE